MANSAWIRRTAKMFGKPVSASDIACHAELIGIQPNRLLACMAPSGTATVRRITSALYTRQEREESESEVTAVPEDCRTAIRSEYCLYDKKYHSNRKEFNFIKPFGCFFRFRTDTPWMYS